MGALWVIRGRTKNWKSTYHEIQGRGPPPHFKSLNRHNSALECYHENRKWCLRLNFQYLNGYNSAADWSISLQFGTEFDHMTTDVLQYVQGQRVKVQGHSLTQGGSSKALLVWNG